MCREHVGQFLLPCQYLGEARQIITHPGSRITSPISVRTLQKMGVSRSGSGTLNGANRQNLLVSRETKKVDSNLQRKEDQHTHVNVSFDIFQSAQPLGDVLQKRVCQVSMENFLVVHSVTQL